MLVKHLKAAYGTDFIVLEPLLEAALHEKVLKVTRKDHNIFVHLRYFVTKPASCLAVGLLIELVQLMQAESLQLQNIVAVFKHGEFRICIKPATNAHEYASMVTYGPVGYN